MMAIKLKNHKRSLMIFSLVLLLLCFKGLGQADETSARLPRETVAVSVGGDGFARFTGSELQYLSDTGEPGIPYLVVKMVLPPDADPATVTATLKNVRLEKQPGTWQVRPIPPAATRIHGREVVSWPMDRTIVDSKDTAVYGREGVFPKDLVAGVTTGKLRAWQIVEVPVAAFQYTPLSGKLYRLKQGRLVVQFSRKPALLSGQQEPVLSADGVADEQVRRMAVNFDEMAPRYWGERPAASAAQSPPGYAIVTTNAIANAVSGSAGQLDSFMRSKKDQGFDVYLVTEDQWGGGMGDAAADNIRSWLVSNYVKLKLKYVLLIGNPSPHADVGDVPMKMLWPLPCDNDTDANPVPSDYYYAELSGNWDLNGNGKFGESPQAPCYQAPDLADFGQGGVDRFAEVIVGRIPYYGKPDDLNHILQKTVTYEREGFNGAGWRENVLLPMMASDKRTLGYQLGEEIKNKVLFTQDWEYHRIYQKAYRNVLPPPETTPCTYETVTAAWNAGDHGAVFWWTHGSEDDADQIMDGNHTVLLSDNRPLITFQCSCLNAYPEYPNNLAFSLLKNGAVATIAATRYSWYWRGQVEFQGTTSNAGMTYEFADRLIARKMAAGEALYDVYANLARTGPGPGSKRFEVPWANQCVFNLYGDPSLGLSSYLPTILVAASDAYVAEAGKRPGIFTFYRMGPSTKALKVKYSVSGTAVGGKDYKKLPGMVTIPARAVWAMVKVVPIGDTSHEGRETVTVRLRPDSRYEVGSGNEAVITIRDKK